MAGMVRALGEKSVTARRPRLGRAARLGGGGVASRRRLEAGHPRHAAPAAAARGDRARPDAVSCGRAAYIFAAQTPWFAERALLKDDAARVGQMLRRVAARARRTRRRRGAGLPQRDPDPEGRVLRAGVLPLGGALGGPAGRHPILQADPAAGRRADAAAARRARHLRPARGPRRDPAASSPACTSGGSLDGVGHFLAEEAPTWSPARSSAGARVADRPPEARARPRRDRSRRTTRPRDAPGARCRAVRRRQLARAARRRDAKRALPPDEALAEAQRLILGGAAVLRARGARGAVAPCRAGGAGVLAGPRADRGRAHPHPARQPRGRDGDPARAPTTSRRTPTVIAASAWRGWSRRRASSRDGSRRADPPT